MASKKSTSVFVGISAALTNVLFWGIAPSIIKYGLDVVSPQVFLYYRFLIAVIISTPFAYLMRKSFSSANSFKHILRLIFIGIFSTLNLGILFFGLTFTTSSAASVITTSVPLFVILGSALFLKENITKKEVIGAAVAMIGTLIIIASTPAQSHASNPVLGNAIVFFYNMIWTTGILLMKKYAKTYSPFVFGYTGWVIGLVAFGITSLVTHPEYVLHPLLVISVSQAFLPIFYMALFGSVIAFTAYQIAQKHLPASQVSIFTYLQTVISVPVSVMWLKETLGTSFALGAVLIIAGVVVAEVHGKSRIFSLYKKKRK